MNGGCLLQAASQAEPAHGVRVVHLPADLRRRCGAAQCARHPARHATTQALVQVAAQHPGQRQPDLISPDLRFGRGAQRPLQGLRVVVANVHCDDARHPIRVACRKFIAKGAAPVVQQQGYGLPRADPIQHLAQQRAHVRQGRGPRCLRQVKARQRQPHAAELVLQGGHRAVPQVQRVGPAVQHQHGVPAAAFHPYGHAVDVICLRGRHDGHGPMTAWRSAALVQHCPVW